MWANFGWLAMYKPLSDYCNQGYDALPIDKVDILVNSLLEANILYGELRKQVISLDAADNRKVPKKKDGNREPNKKSLAYHCSYFDTFPD